MLWDTHQPGERLRARVVQVQRRLTLNRFLGNLSVSLFLAASVAFLLVLADRLVCILVPSGSVPFWQVAVGLGAIGLLVALLRTLRHSASAQQAALRIDARCDLRERCSSADLLLHRDDAERLGGFARAVVEDAETRVQEVQPGSVSPVRLPRGAGLVLVPVALAALATSFMPQLDLLGRGAQERIARAEEKERQEIARKLRESAKQLDRAMPLRKLDVPQTLVDELSELADRIEKERLPRRQGAARLSKITDQMSEESRRLQEDDRTRAALRQLKRSTSNRRVEQLRELEKALESGDLQKASQALRELQERVGDSEHAARLSEQEQQELQQELEEIAKRLEMKDQELARQLREAARSLDEKDMESLARALGEAADELAEQEEMLETLERLQTEERELSALMEDLLQSDVCEDCGKYFDPPKEGGT